MKKFFLILVMAIFAFVACEEPNRTIKTNVKPGYVCHEYTLDTLSNGHIIMRDISSREHGFIEYPECPKCDEHLKKLITEVVDSINQKKDEAIVDNLSKINKSEEEEISF